MIIRAGRSAIGAAGAAVLILFSAVPGVAQPADRSGRGKEIRIVVAAGAGGGWGLNARLLSDHMRRHIPGNPSVVPQFMPGASGITAANYLYNAAPRDGTALGLLLKDLAVTQKLRPEARFDARKFAWIGRIAPVRSVIFVWHTSPATTIDKLKTTEIIAGSLGKSDQSYVNPVVLDYLAGTKIRVIGGFRGSADVLLGMERGEVHAWSGSWDAMKATHEKFLAEKKIIPLVQCSLSPAPDLKNVPVLTQFARDDESRTMATFLIGGSDIGLSVSAPPGVPAEKIQALRKAFEATMRDPAYVAAAAKAKTAVEPATGDQVAAIIDRMTSISTATLDKVKQAIK